MDIILEMKKYVIEDRHEIWFTILIMRCLNRLSV